MKAPLDFYFDFSSPYGYLAAQKIETLAAKHGRGVTWRPMLLGAAFKATGATPLPSVPIKGDYAKRDFLRSARFHDIPFRIPDQFPISTLHACRAFYAAPPDKQTALAKGLFRAYFVDNINIGEADNVLKIAGSLGLKPDLNEQALKDRTRAEGRAPRSTPRLPKASLALLISWWTASPSGAWTALSNSIAG
jgi:2-hydroxychromene-2-carboxylate isomerase